MEYHVLQIISYTLYAEQSLTELVPEAMEYDGPTLFKDFEFAETLYKWTIL